MSAKPKPKQRKPRPPPTPPQPKPWDAPHLPKRGDAKKETTFAAIGEIVVKWNDAENFMNAILVELCGSNPKTWILTAELGNVGLENALRTAAADIAPIHLREHLDHAIEWFSRLRETRNYYVHGIRRITTDKGGTPLGIIQQVSAKSALVFHNEDLPLDRLRTLSGRINELTIFLLAINVYLHQMIAQEHFHGPPPSPLPRMPPLPDRLVKPRRYLQGDKHPREKSQSRPKPKPRFRKS
jgi:hypothetical protein